MRTSKNIAAAVSLPRSVSSLQFLLNNIYRLCLLTGICGLRGSIYESSPKTSFGSARGKASQPAGENQYLFCINAEELVVEELNFRLDQVTTEKSDAEMGSIPPVWWLQPLEKPMDSERFWFWSSKFGIPKLTNIIHQTSSNISPFSHNRRNHLLKCGAVAGHWKADGVLRPVTDVDRSGFHLKKRWIFPGSRGNYIILSGNSSSNPADSGRVEVFLFTRG